MPAPPPHREWVVLKFGGTSVATPERWSTIAALVGRRIAEGVRPLVVCSALAGVSNQLEELLGLATRGEHEVALAHLVQRHRELAQALGVDAVLLDTELEELRRLSLAASLLRDASPALTARVMALGELLATRLGAASLNAGGIATAWLDARTALLARDEPSARPGRAYLAASCDPARDDALRQRLADEPASAVLTQGFIARNAHGETVLLGRGGSDTSAAYFAALLAAQRCEIWTDVPGMFTANPALIPSARLLRALDYDEAQEIATTGAKVLHPRSIPPLRKARIPLHVLSTARPDAPGTVISDRAPDSGPQVKAISSRQGVTLVSMEAVSMWQEVGFLAEVFACFARHGLSIDAVSTSETNVTISLDPGVNALDGSTLRELLRELSTRCEARLIAPTASLSLVGRGIRAILHELGPVLEVFEELKVHMLTQSASDLNLTFFVDQDDSERLVRQLHELLFGQSTENQVLGPQWSELGQGDGAPAPARSEWWRDARPRLLELAATQSPVYVYDRATLETAARTLQSLGADRLLYAIKANSHPGVLGVFHRLGLGFECVSIDEVEHVRASFPDLPAERILFTPNFAHAEEYARGFALGVRVTVDNLHPLEIWPELFAGREFFVRLDPGHGRGHHAHVRTAGAHSKFGIAPAEIDTLANLVRTLGASIVGLHAHVGSGIRQASAWSDVGMFLAEQAERFPKVRVFDLGGGLGIPERPGQAPLDLTALAATIARFRAVHPGREIWLEPGRFLVAEAGVLLARVTQLKRKGEIRYVGLETGMNSLIRPALYGAHHGIVNLTRLDEPSELVAHVVGPICESGDILGRARRLAPTVAGDVFLIATAGAYGRVMSSRYNLREPASEALLEPISPATP